MNSFRKDRIKEIFSRHGKLEIDEPEKVKEASKVQGNYMQRLRHDIRSTLNFIEQADSAISKFKDENGADDDILKLKIEIVALWFCYNRLPYVPDKQDTIGIATASVSVREQIEDQAETFDMLLQEIQTLRQERRSFETLNSDYRQLTSLIDKKIDFEKSKTQEIESKISSMEKAPIEASQQMNALQENIQMSRDMEDTLLASLRRTLTKYLAISDWQLLEVMTAEEFESNTDICIQLIDTLILASIKSVKQKIDEWLVVYPSKTEERLINHLVRSSLLVIRDDSTYEKYVVKMRNFCT